MSAVHNFRNFAELEKITSSDLEAAGRVIRSVSRIVEPAKPAEGIASVDALHLAKDLKAMRLIRNSMFTADLFGEPAWDMLLALFIARSEQYRLKISDLTLESNVPATTALRWIETLVKENLARKVANPRDARSTFIEMTDQAFEQLTHAFDRMLSRSKFR